LLEPTSRHNSASRRAPLVRLVVAFPSASASPSRCPSAWPIGLRHSLGLKLLLRPSRSVGCGVARCLNPHLVATPPGASASALADPSLVTAFGVVCRRSRCPPPYLSSTTSPSPEREAPEHCRFCCCRGARPSPARGLLRCCRHSERPHALPSPAWGLPHRCPPCTHLARVCPRGGIESESMMFVFREHRWSWAKKPVVLASCDKINTKLT
jgi:hypothetical protein